jgi:hypothetical protein
MKIPKILFRKGLVIGVICLLLLLSPVIPAFSIQDRNNEELISNQKGALPDLDIFGIFALYKYWPEGTPYFVLECRIKNIGGYAGFITIWVEVVGELYNTDNNTYETYNTFNGNLSCYLSPDEEVFIEFARDHDYNYVHPFGKIRFRAECHTNVDESNYNNNHHTQLFYHPWYKIWIPLPIRFKNDNQNIQTTQQTTNQRITIQQTIIGNFLNRLIRR